ncbi:phospholipid phosphatase 6-like [Actinia tenebrosa]|uniref:Phospholipid phosphatase 6-like n=1 Tax=Actinia tenebrosa TaxID=6105 RepID=A0A6P8HWV0_ACTTE|nr:phospholipid phosphatase 6-like [Actinia tenebrosa]
MATKQVGSSGEEIFLNHRKTSRTKHNPDQDISSENPRNQGSFIDTLHRLDIELSRRLSFCAAKDSGWRPVLIALEISGHGVPWIIATLLAIYFFRNEKQQFALNFLLALLLDLVIVGLTKVIFQRQRPVYNEKDMFATVSVDNFSFPSGHSTRAAMVAALFNLIISSSCLRLVINLWACSVAISRVVLGRHHVFDVVFGAIIGLGQYWLMVNIWLSMEFSHRFLMLVPYVDLK